MEYFFKLINDQEGNNIEIALKNEQEMKSIYCFPFILCWFSPRRSQKNEKYIMRTPLLLSLDSLSS